MTYINESCLSYEDYFYESALTTGVTSIAITVQTTNISKKEIRDH